MKCFFEKQPTWSSPKPLSYTAFAQRAQFSSRGYMNDILQQRKRLTPASFDRIAKGLQLPQAWKNYLLILAQKEDPVLWKVKNPNSLEIQAKTTQALLMKGLSVKEVSPQSLRVQLMTEPHFSEIYASLGDPTQGVTLQTIIGRSRTEKDIAVRILSKMLEHSMVDYHSETKKYFIKNLDLQGIDLDAFFETDFQRALNKMHRRAKTQFSSTSSLFMTQTFSVSIHRLPKLKNQLRDLINQFAVDSEEAHGDCIAEICLGMTNNKDE